MKARLPFEILPTLSIVNAPYPDATTPPVQSISSVPKKTVVPREVKELDEEQGKRIIQLIHDRDGTMEKKVGVLSTYQPAAKPHQSSFYVKAPSLSNVPKKELGLLEKASDYLGLASTNLIKHIDRDLLIQNGITIGDLVGECDIGITDLMSAGIVTDVPDLLKLGFKMTDVVINRTRFQAQQLADLFQLNYEKLRRLKGVKFSVIDLIACKFYPNELAALGFSFDYMVRNNGINAVQLRCLNFSLSDLVSLQLTKEHLKILGITRSQALNDFKWDRKEYASFIG